MAMLSTVPSFDSEDSSLEDSSLEDASLEELGISVVGGVESPSLELEAAGPTQELSKAAAAINIKCGCLLAIWGFSFIDTPLIVGPLCF